MYVNVIKNYVEAIIKCRYRLTKKKNKKKGKKKKKKYCSSYYKDKYL